MQNTLHKTLFILLVILMLAFGGIGCVSSRMSKNQFSGLVQNIAQAGSADVEVTVDLARISGTSSFSPGMTHIDHTLQSGDATAIANVKSLLANGLVFQNTFIMAWGPPDPWPDPSANEPSNWTYLDKRLELMFETGATPVISLMNAPWWMKGQLQSNGTTKLIPDVSGEWQSASYKKGFTDYRGITYPAGYVSPDPYASRILDNQMDNWLHLVKRVAERYMVAPYNVRYFQVWNEMKGYYNNALNRWDYEDQAGDSSGYNAKHGYTYMYNRVYQVLREVAAANEIDPDSIYIGGPYIVVKTWTSSQAGGFPAQEPLLQNKPYGTYDQRDADVIKYWLRNKAGAGFIVVDASDRNREETSLADVFTANDKFADILGWIRSLDIGSYPGADTLPVFFAEWYANPYNSFDRAYNNAVKADAVIKSIKAGTRVILTWGGVENTSSWMINPSMYTNPNTASGGLPLPWYFSYKAFRDYFSPGTPLLMTSQSSEDVTVLASPIKTMLVNKTNASLTVSVNGLIYTLAAYEVRILETPQNPAPTPTPSAIFTPTETAAAISTTTPTETATATMMLTETATNFPTATETANATMMPTETATHFSTVTGTASATPTNTFTPIPPTPTQAPDSTLPTITITYPSNGSTVKKNSIVTIKVTATDNIGISRVEFAVTGSAGSYSCTDTTAAYTCKWPVPGQARIPYMIVATAFDLSGNSASAQIQVTSSR